MSTLVIFDSSSGTSARFGSAANTRTAANSDTAAAVADAIAVELGEGTRAVPVDSLGLDSLTGIEVLVVGSPIVGWRPSPRLQAFLVQLHPGTLRGVRAAAFDTRLRTVLHGDAAGKISRALEKAGAHVVAPPTGFIVEGRGGPLASGEAGRAAAWAGSIASVLRH
ncbi:flavodoxin [Cryobacterium sinapicolor]|uniref:Flavodoxin n=1 Tax=Cryobacterium sinapicolor TaxID=1259236 RepID=A0ABY2JAW8_9MICO|nr:MULTISPECIES: flavodoxin [Cryobacterium]TFC83353.1 flavodoxin [Cryobacterium sp. TMT3-29-2]TFD02097.1 flavodoxin [Cryobacterium sinapicolor]